ncbi:type II toxin-antitoxin system RelE/ParE family toxin [Flavobacterium subsaxonicum]|uniref:Plasmid stabilization system n=1 Tax=Flavobacterium subsaxonicum WB 4.1-42 = DSM 21790 TaxID=1121898 RepID=A0A0A2MNU8_9FLAO|nr:type II toxin-antitoxin system RelE/ParE family toxin [Flavobacterium subsaxonicum]KGO94357.1 hypothetical protein Q766_05410 [Flavobacterium subsaxonicum WB 4.1-42 = DSM 21790]
MNYLIKIRKQALLNIEESAEWYKEKQQGLELKFLKDLNSAIDIISKDPEKFQVRYRDVRIKFLKKFDFGIHYIIDENSIHILAVFHTSRSPLK